MRTCIKSLSVLGAAALFSATVLAQEGSLKAQLSRNGPTANATSPYVTSSASSTPPDNFSVQYYIDPLGVGTIGEAETIDIVDPGTNGAGNLCADIYVIDASEEMTECCGCLITPDQLVEFTFTNLLTNPANGIPSEFGDIKLVSSAPGAGGTCNPGKPTPTPALRAWKVLAIENDPNQQITDAPFLPATLSTGELNTLSSTCEGFEKTLSGTGICTCPAQLPD